MSSKCESDIDIIVITCAFCIFKFRQKNSPKKSYVMPNTTIFLKSSDANQYTDVQSNCTNFYILNSPWGYSKITKSHFKFSKLKNATKNSRLEKLDCYIKKNL